MEGVLIDQWLYERLHGDATLMALVTDVYSYPAPAGATLPYVLIQEQLVSDVRGVGSARIGVRGAWLVRGVVDTSSWGGAMTQIADRIDVLLQAKSGSVTGGSIWGCVRIRPFRLSETYAGRSIRHLGGVYEVFAT